MGCCSSTPEETRRTRAKSNLAIRDRFETLEQVQAALQKAGLESSNLIIGVDFTKSNTWTGKRTFQGRSLHFIGNTEFLNPYEQAIDIIGRTLSVFDDDQLIPAYGFGDVTTTDRGVFSFNDQDVPCRGFQEVLSRYRQIASYVNLSGPTSFGPIIRRAIDIVSSSRAYHILLIVADGQVTQSDDGSGKTLSPQESDTINAIVEASKYPLSIVMVGVGDGPWDQMEDFDDRLPARAFDNFQFVNFHEVMNQVAQGSPEYAAAHFATNALMEIPDQFSYIKSNGILGSVLPSLPSRQMPSPPPINPATIGYGHQPPGGVSKQGNFLSSLRS
eukprot:TRINITY_DN963_c0_g3_i4.p1 TRINITY_DN963_c0_g3~~TRINITY_DN963_c0_g3_i4.p1  ORF type:complete len:330 (+),score=57.88 TRINITY_DN963_c0_g3_i4:76-1065(+)